MKVETKTTSETDVMEDVGRVHSEGTRGLILLRERGTTYRGTIVRRGDIMVRKCTNFNDDLTFEELPSLLQKGP